MNSEVVLYIPDIHTEHQIFSKHKLRLSQFSLEKILVTVFFIVIVILCLTTVTSIYFIIRFANENNSNPDRPKTSLATPFIVLFETANEYIKRLFRKFTRIP